MLLQAKSITHYFGGLCAVSDFNLDLQAGELVGIIGPNGAGKTTIFNLITGVYRSTQGSFQFEGTELVGLRSNRITDLGIANYGQIHYSPFVSLFHIGRFGLEEDRTIDEAMDLLAVFKLEDYADETSKNLPYGLQRRLEIARALATHPKLLLLDEPAAGMNPNEIMLLMDFIQWIRQEFKLTIILIEHQMRLVMGICERIKVLDFGATIAEGLPAEIQNNPKVLEAYLGEGAEL
jgi:branched-chain amino acid transport system ATP-binding protein